MAKRVLTPFEWNGMTFRSWNVVAVKGKLTLHSTTAGPDDYANAAMFLYGRAISPDHAAALALLDRATTLLRKPEREAAQEQDALADEIDAFLTTSAPTEER